MALDREGSAEENMELCLIHSGETSPLTNV